MNKSSINNYDCILNFKTKIIKNENIITKLKELVEVMKTISSSNNLNTIKLKTYNKCNNVPNENKLISLLNLLTDTNKDDICKKIPDLLIEKKSIENLINILHKKMCNEYHFIENYIYIIKYVIQSGIYNFSDNYFWKFLIMKCQNVFELINNNLTSDDIDTHCGNLILIFYLCKERLLSLKVLSVVLDKIIDIIEGNDMLVNILFKLFDFIPIDNKYIEILKQKIETLLKKQIPFRLKFKIDQITEKFPNDSSSNKNKKSNNNIVLENLIIKLINEYNKDNSLIELENKINSIKNFRKSYFFKIFIFNLIKLNITSQSFNSLLNFIYNRKYRPSNFKNIYLQINKTLKKINNSEYNRKYSIIFNKKN